MKNNKRRRRLRDQHGLVGSVSCHARVGVVGDQVQMWRHFVLLFAAVEVHHLHCVQWQPLERVDCHAEEARVCVDVPVDVSLAQIVVHGGVVQVGQVRHVVTLFVFGRVHRQQVVSLTRHRLFNLNKIISILKIFE